MQFLHKAFGLDKTYETKHGLAFLIDTIVVVGLASLGVSLLLQQLGEENNTWVILIGVLITFYFVQELVQSVYAWRITKKREYLPISLAFKGSRFHSSAIGQLLQDTDHDRRVNIIEETDGWQLFDVEYSLYRRTKHGKYKASEIHHTVFEVNLQRVVPHVIFDSKHAKGRQFRYNYLQSQRISFEGEVDSHFDSYAPQTYHIDALSFLTPEVLQEVVALKDYDLEFFDRSLMCYAPLLTDRELEIFKQKCLRLFQSVNDNLNTYRDDRLTGEQRRSDVTNFGRQLLLSPMKYLPIFILSGLGIVGILYLCMDISWEILFDRFSLLIMFTFAANGMKIWKITRDNRRMEQVFLQKKFEAAQDASTVSTVR